MDINSLLSPQDAPARSAPQPQTQPLSQPQQVSKKRGRPVGGKRNASALSQEILLSPSPDPRIAADQGSSNVQQHLQTQQRPGYLTPYGSSKDVRASQSVVNATASDNLAASAAQQQRPAQYATHRHPSTSQMETLADLASMQQRQQTPQIITSIPNTHVAATQRSPPRATPATSSRMPPNARTHSASDLIMAEAPTSTPSPRVFVATSLSDADSQTITDLISYLPTNTYDYNTHVQLINLLHRGFVAHVNGQPEEPLFAAKPSDYGLLPELRQARTAMDSRFAVGEEIWKDWIADESLLVKTSEDRSSVMELCMRAVQEEPASVSLWKVYGEWVWATYAAANGFVETKADVWTEEDKMICREVFTRDLVLSVWKQAVNATKWRVDESHIIWDRYVELIMQDFPEHPSPKTVEEVRSLYMSRLQVPHAAWSNTSQAFWPFISKHEEDKWEAIMAATNEDAAPAKQAYALRADFELNVERSLNAEDQSALYDAFSTYLAWEAKPRRKKSKFDTELRCALYERALLKFSTMVEWWLDYADLLTDTSPSSSEILPLLERATRHCPWSGELWSRRLLRIELEGSYDDVEGVKHKATNSGLLIVGGLEEMLIVYAAWCSFLRRRAFDSSGGDDDIDMAEMAMAELLSDVQITGKRTYGEDFQGDPLWRIEKLFIKFLTQAGRYDEARQQYKNLVTTQGHTYEFWANYYYFEIWVWSTQRLVDGVRMDTPERRPANASAVMREAMAQKTLDWPEKLLELVAHHFQIHEVPEEVQRAQVELRAAQRRLKYKREREAEAAAAAAAEEAQQAEPAPADDTGVANKRKREDETNGDAFAKRSKVGEQAQLEASSTEASASASAQNKRDREHNTITVTSLPGDMTDKRLRQFFADCGNVLSVSLLSETDGSATATVEFESHEDVLAARTRDGKEVAGKVIHIKSGSQSTLYVANYPPDFDEVKIRELFTPYGPVVSVRFPSLKYDQRRRFCYVQFLTAEDARAATALDNKTIGQSTLLAKISDPDAKKKREGALAEGREVCVKNVDHAATEQDIRDLFDRSGQIEHVRRIQNPITGKLTGTCFVVFANAEQATAALSQSNKPLKSRIVAVELATDKSTREAANKRAGQKHVIQGASASPAPEEADANDRRMSINSATSSQNNNTAGAPIGRGDETSSRTKNQRTIALLNLPDTVNDARIQSFFESYGPLVQVYIRRDKSGAMVEFKEVADAGKVNIGGVDCSVLGPEVRIGEVGELFASKGKGGGRGAVGGRGGGPNRGRGGGGGGGPGSADGAFMRPAQAGGVARPAQRGGRRGGLGFKRGRGHGGSGLGTTEDQGEGQAGNEGPEQGKAKSNDDFRALFVKSAGGKEGEQNGNGEGGDEA